jgi:non-heme chloroperoxidase
MKRSIIALALALVSSLIQAAPAIDVVGKDVVLPNRLAGLPARLSEFKGLQINDFTTSDGIRLRYWEAGTGKPLIFVPGWSANGAEYFNVMALLAPHYRVIVLDPRNQGLSDKASYGNRIARYAMDVKELTDHLHIKTADYCGWSMGASVLWSYIDLFGSKGMHKAVFVDEPIAIVARNSWSAQRRSELGAFMPSADTLIQALQIPVPQNPDPETTNFVARSQLRDSPYFSNSESLAAAVINNDASAMMQVMYDHGSNDWSDVLEHKLTMPVAIFSGEYSANLPSQRWAQQVIPGSKLYIYTKQEQGDHFLMFKNPMKFTRDLQDFLER